MDLRPYQSQLLAEVRGAWEQGARNVLMRLDTGGGKTIILSDVVRVHVGASAVIAHRQELVSQLSLALARQGVRHNLIAARATCKAVVAEHLTVLGRSYYDPGARCAVASVDTLIRAEGLEAWAAQVTLWITDEGHHLVEDNKWHTAISLFTHPAVRGLLPTATPMRADGKGLGRDQGGVADVMVQGPPMRWLIDEGFLTDYRIVCVESDLTRMVGDVGATGDWSNAQLRDAAKRSHIVGDVVAEYQRWASGMLGITFTTDVDTAVEVTQGYQAAGVRAATLTGKTDSGVRRAILRDFEARRLDQIVAVDIISEGFDLPAIEVASFARPTESLALYMQQFGRVLRPMPGKPVALIIDHVNNFLRHGPPDRPRPWSLLAREGRRGVRSDAIPLRACLSCFQPYERVEPVCPYCGAEPPAPAVRSSPEAVAGDLTLLDADTLARLRGAVEATERHRDEVRQDLILRHVPPIGVMAGVKRHEAAREAQAALRDAMARWAGPLHAEGRSDRYLQRLFWERYGVDVLTAQTLGAAEADALREKLA